MSFDRIAEVESLLGLDEHREGRLWRWYRNGKDDAAWMAANNVKTPPTNAKHAIEVLRTGIVPNGPAGAEYVIRDRQQGIFSFNCINNNVGNLGQQRGKWSPGRQRIPSPPGFCR